MSNSQVSGTGPAAPAQENEQTSEQGNAPEVPFFIFAGRQRFCININELRKESWLFGSHPSITSIELRYEDPAAVQLIENYFNGNIGVTPFSNEARATFRDAAKIAKTLHLYELADQLEVIVIKTDRAFVDLVYTQQNNGAQFLSRDMIIEYVRLDVEKYLNRTPVEEREAAEYEPMAAFDPVFNPFMVDLVDQGTD